ncbi:MAG: histidine phosphatase family protein [bacterium]
MNIYVIRHGLTELNKHGIINGHKNDPLAPEGVEQARAAAPLLPKTIKHFYVSSLERAKQTAAILNESIKIPMSFHDELREVNFGDLNGTPFLEEYKKDHKAQTYDWRPSGESVEDVKSRVLTILSEIKKKSGDGEALLVTHGGIIRMLHFLQFGEPLDEIENASLHVYDLDKMLQTP